jgi:hypothetical protein
VKFASAGHAPAKRGVQRDGGVRAAHVSFDDDGEAVFFHASLDKSTSAK